MKKETKNEKSMFKMSVIIRSAIIALILVFIGCCMISFVRSNDAFASAKLKHSSFNYDFSYNHDTTTMTNISLIKNENTVLPHDSIRNQMIKAVDMYIDKVTRGKYDKMLPEYLVDNSLKHNIDLCFMMSQTEIETAFGTTGAGRPTSRRSLFGIIKKRWTNYNDAIQDYCILLKKSYLVRGRTEQDLMRNYVTGSGARYASSRSYEVDLKKTYHSICKKTNLLNLQQSYKKAYDTYVASKSNSLKIDSINS